MIQHSSRLFKSNRQVQFFRQKVAFTLIELLVVIAIIGILSGLIIVGMSNATNSANDAKRKANIETIRKALMMYQANNGGIYPIETTQCNIGPSGISNRCDNLATLLSSLLATLPTDPITGVYYQYGSDGVNFYLVASLSRNIYEYSSYSGFINNASLVNYWPMHEGAGTSIADKAGSSIGTINGTLNWDTNSRLVFNGTTNIVTFSSLTAYAKNSPHTYCAWIKPGNPNSDYSWILNNGSNGDGTSLIARKVSAQLYIGFFTDGGTTVCNGNSVVSLNSWHHVCGVYGSDNNITFYLEGINDGVKVGSVNSWTAINSNPRLGSWSPGTDYFIGTLDDVRIYNSALSQSDISAVYNAGKLTHP